MAETRTTDRQALLEEESIILRNSGEIPEIALHSSLYFLTEDEAGPLLALQEDELELLYSAALARAREIVLRDLDPHNRDLRIYRGVARSMVNWQRLRKFCNRINRQCPGFREQVAAALRTFLHNEMREVRAGRRASSVNCCARDLDSYCRELSLEISSLPPGWATLCPE
ncbi:MAG: class I SAM-dependent methyltransferase [Desulfobulbaceae bacterium]